MHHHTDLISHTTAFVKYVEHWLEQEIAQLGGVECYDNEMALN